MTVQEALELIRNAVYGEEVRGAICDAISAIDDVAENLIPPFEPTDSYEAGDLVFYEDNIYKFTQAHTGAWNLAHVIQTTLSDELEKEFNIAIAAFPTDETSGSIASFSDGADGVPIKDMTIQIVPKQDLHGYDYPWPSGGGPNFATETGAYSDFDGYYIDSSTHKIVSAGSNFHRCILIPCTASKKYILRSGAATTVRASVYDATPTTSATPTAYVDGKSLTSNPTQIEITTTASSKYILVQLFADVDTSSGAWSGYTDAQMYEIATTGLYFSWDSNICPISGYLGAEIVRTGKNLIIESIASANVNSGGKIVSSNDYDLFIAPIKSGVDYAVTDGIPDGTLYAEFATLPAMGDFAPNGRVILAGDTFTATMDGYVVFRTNHGYATPMIEVGTTATTYVAPITPTTYTVTWTDHGMVYGGTLTDNGDGTWTLQPMHEIIDASQVSWTAHTGGDIPMRLYATTQFSNSGEAWAEQYKTFTGSINDTPLNNFRVSPTSGLYVATGSSADPEGKFVLKYLVASRPASITLTAESVKTLFGNNNVWADTGSIDLTYRADPSKYIAKKFAELPNAQGVSF